jgi:hypothetical protein
VAPSEAVTTDIGGTITKTTHVFGLCVWCVSSGCFWIELGFFHGAAVTQAMLSCLRSYIRLISFAILWRSHLGNFICGPDRAEVSGAPANSSNSRHVLPTMGVHRSHLALLALLALICGQAVAAAGTQRVQLVRKSAQRQARLASSANEDEGNVRLLNYMDAQVSASKQRSETDQRVARFTHEAVGGTVGSGACMRGSSGRTPSLPFQHVLCQILRPAAC